MIKDSYLYYSVFSNINEFIPLKGSTYLYGHSTEGRSHTVDELVTKLGAEINFVEIQELEVDKIKDNSDNSEYSLRSSKSILEFYLKHPSEIFYIDVTGLNNRISASLLNNGIKAIEQGLIKEFKVIYVEPLTYNIQRFKSEGVFHDLSEKINGIEPLPGFASIMPDSDNDASFIALLGFEGGRFTHMIENVQPQKEKIVPIIGVPGYRAEYPFVAYWGNRRPLEETETWRNVKYVEANSAVEVYYLLSKILSKNPNKKIKLAPIGTKPHAIGAILFAIKHPTSVELVYDNPVRKTERTKGVGKIMEFDASKLIQEK